MTLHVGRAIGRGAHRSLSSSGIVALVLTISYQLLFVGSVNTIVVDRLPSGVQSSSAGVGFPLLLSTEAAAGTGRTRAVARQRRLSRDARLLTRTLSALSSLPGELLTRRLGQGFLSVLAISVILGVATPVGFVLFFIPGLFLVVTSSSQCLSSPSKIPVRSRRSVEAGNWRVATAGDCLHSSSRSA
jgi:hypothetical protein